MDRFPGRWGDHDGNFRTVYVGASLLACLLEVLADFRLDPDLAEDFAEIGSTRLMRRRSGVGRRDDRPQCSRRLRTAHRRMQL